LRLAVAAAAAPEVHMSSSPFRYYMLLQIRTRVV
jgi:hypothetical protein